MTVFTCPQSTLFMGLFRFVCNNSYVLTYQSVASQNVRHYSQYDSRRSQEPGRFQSWRRVSSLISVDHAFSRSVSLNTSSNCSFSAGLSNHAPPVSRPVSIIIEVARPSCIERLHFVIARHAITRPTGHGLYHAIPHRALTWSCISTYNGITC